MEPKQATTTTQDNMDETRTVGVLDAHNFSLDSLDAMPVSSPDVIEAEMAAPAPDTPVQPETAMSAGVATAAAAAAVATATTASETATTQAESRSDIGPVDSATTASPIDSATAAATLADTMTAAAVETATAVAAETVAAALVESANATPAPSPTTTPTKIASAPPTADQESREQQQQQQQDQQNLEQLESRECTPPTSPNAMQPDVDATEERQQFHEQQAHGQEEQEEPQQAQDKQLQQQSEPCLDSQPLVSECRDDNGQGEEENVVVHSLEKQLEASHSESPSDSSQDRDEPEPEPEPELLQSEPEQQPEPEQEPQPELQPDQSLEQAYDAPQSERHPERDHQASLPQSGQSQQEQQEEPLEEPLLADLSQPQLDPMQLDSQLLQEQTFENQQQQHQQQGALSLTLNEAYQTFRTAVVGDSPRSSLDATESSLSELLEPTEANQGAKPTMEFTKNYSDDLLMGGQSESHNSAADMANPIGDLAEFELPTFSGSSSGSEQPAADRPPSPVRRKASSSTSATTTTTTTAAQSSSQHNNGHPRVPNLNSLITLATSNYARISHVVEWNKPIESGVLFAIGLIFLTALTFFSIISVVAYTALATIATSGIIRVYKSIMKTLNRPTETPIDHIWSKILAVNVTMSPEKMHELVDTSMDNLNSTLMFLKQALIFDDLVATLKIGSTFFMLTYIGAWFNGMTLITLSYLALFSIPIVYKKNKTNIDECLNLLSNQMGSTISMITSKIGSFAFGTQGGSAGGDSTKKRA